MVYIESNFECSKTLPRNAGELTDKTKIRSKNRCEISSSANYRSKVRLESSSSANYRSNFRAEWNNRCHEIRNFRFIEKPGKARKFVEIDLHYFCTILYLHYSVDIFYFIRTVIQFGHIRLQHNLMKYLSFSTNDFFSTKGRGSCKFFSSFDLVFVSSSIYISIS